VGLFDDFWGKLHFCPKNQFDGITGIELITGSRKRESINTIWINNSVTQLLLEGMRL
jgi:hypothetical protein